MPSWRVADVRSLANTLTDLARALEDAAAEASARAVDDGDGELALSVVRGTALAGNVAEALDAALERVREHAGDAFADVRATRRATKSVMRTRGGDGDDGSVDAEGDVDETFEDMFDAEGKPRRGAGRGMRYTLPGMNAMAMGELRGVLKKVGVKAAASEGDSETSGIEQRAEEAALSSGAEADGEASEVEAMNGDRREITSPVPSEAPKAEKPQWMIELAAKNAAKRAAQKQEP